MDDGYDLDYAEQLACTFPDSREKQLLREVTDYARSLQHQLADPNYLYAGSRIHRQDILKREQSIKWLKETGSCPKEVGK